MPCAAILPGSMPLIRAFEGKPGLHHAVDGLSGAMVMLATAGRELSPRQTSIIVRNGENRVATPAMVHPGQLKCRCAAMRHLLAAHVLFGRNGFVGDRYFFRTQSNRSVLTVRTAGGWAPWDGLPRPL